MPLNCCMNCKCIIEIEITPKGDGWVEIMPRTGTIWIEIEITPKGDGNVPMVTFDFLVY